MKKKVDISVVIPVYGCRAALETLCERLINSLNKITKYYEIILVNDNCPQNSWEIIEKICSKNEKVIGVELSRNFGQMKAILAGLDISVGEWVVVMDCDLQDRPEEIISLYNKAQEGFDIVFARRAVRSDSFLKKKISKLFYKFYSFATNIKYDEAICNFSICSRKVINSYCFMREEHRTYVMYLQWMGFRTGYVDVEHNSRFEGKSSYNFKKRFKYAFDILFSQSDKLLKSIVGIGFLVTLISLIFVLLIVINYFVNDVKVGWSSIISVICLMSGLIISVIGVVGLYVGNIFVQSKNRPLYFVRQVLNREDE